MLRGEWIGSRCTWRGLRPSRTAPPTPTSPVSADNAGGWLYKNTRDRKVINVDPKAQPGDNSARIEISDPKYLQVVLFDHITRRRTG